MKFEAFLVEWCEQDTVTTADILASFLPLVRETLKTHKEGFVAPLEGIAALHVEQGKIWFEEKDRKLPLANTGKIKYLERQRALSWDIVSEVSREWDIDSGAEKIENVATKSNREESNDQPSVSYVSGYLSWEQKLGHHDPSSDIFSLGMLLASLALQLDFRDEEDLKRFTEHRSNLFAIHRDLHPVLAQTIVRMTDLSRSNRPQDLESVLVGLENYRDQTVALEYQIAFDQSRANSAPKSIRELILTRLRDRLFDVSRRNPLLNFRATAQSLNLTHASLPLSIHIERIREDQIFVWNEELRQQIAKCTPIRLNQLVNVNEAVYVPSVLERLMSDARRDKSEYGCSQLRLVVAFLHWANLKEKPHENFLSPLLLVPIQLTKQKGISDKYSMQALESVAEVNPVIRHLFRQLYDIALPELLDLTTNSVAEFHSWLQQQIAKSEPAVSLQLTTKPPIQLVHEKAKRRMDQYRRSSRIAGRGVSRFDNIDFSYDAINYHPLGIRLFTQRVRQPALRIHHFLTDELPPRQYAVKTDSEEPDRSVLERKVAVFADNAGSNPYHWNFDLCNQTIVNLHYRRMSLVRDYDSIVENALSSKAFEAGFDQTPRQSPSHLPNQIPLEERFEVVRSDPTQSMAIAEARAGQSYIIQGPPGTGKSQTITNLIADFAANGKRVLFVCEKRAAVDVVYARLKQCGIERLCAIVHDSQSDKKEFVMDLKTTYENFLGDSVVPSESESSQKRTQTIQSIRESLDPLQRFEDAMESIISSKDGTVRMSIRELIDRCIEVHSDSPHSTDAASGLPPLSLWWDHQATLQKLNSFLELHCNSKVFRNQPFRLVASSVFNEQDPATRLQEFIAHSLDLLTQFETAICEIGLPREIWNEFDQCEKFLQYVGRISPFSSDSSFQLLDPNSSKSIDFDKEFREAMKCHKEWESHQANNILWKQKLNSQETKIAVEQLRPLEPKFTRWFSPTWWRLRSLLKSRIDFGQLKIRPTWTQSLEALLLEHKAEEKWRQTSKSVETAFDLSGELLEISEARKDWLETSPRLPSWILNIHNSLMKSPKGSDTVRRMFPLRHSYDALRDSCDRFLECWKTLSLEDLKSELANAANCSRNASKFQGIAQWIGELPYEIRHLLRTSPKTIPANEKDIEENALGQFFASRPEMERFTGIEKTRHVMRLENELEPWLRQNAEEICRRCSDRFRARMRLSPSEPEFSKRYQLGRKVLEHEFGKSMRYRPIRELVEGDSGLVVKDLKPIWLMSPLSVADTLPLDSNFVDVVIFDEASQVRLEEAIPTLFRGAQTIIVGDTMQLPPTNFFSSQSSEESEELFVEADSEGGDSESFDLSSESLLSHASKNLNTTMLGWHYRSRSESLINFSNWAFYDGRLLTVPDTQIFSRAEKHTDKSTGIGITPSRADLVLEKSPKYSPTPAQTESNNPWLELPIAFHFLEDSVYEGRKNRREAEHIAKLVSDCLSQENGMTIGVIAFSEAQQTEIESALDALANQDSEFRRRYEAELTREENGQFVGLLVKNLENIQGDERDIILLSICYGPNSQRKTSMNFGPINRNGGERRLNVAFSRAKQHMVVVTSMKSTQITNDYNLGPQCLKQYLRYAECMSQSDVEGASQALRQLSKWQSNSQVATTLPPVTRQLAEALRAANYQVDTEIGQSHFQVDVAVYRNGDKKYRLGILIDTVEAYEHSDPWERDVMRPRLLRNFGWKVHQVLGKDWYKDSSLEVKRILQVLDASDADI